MKALKLTQKTALSNLTVSEVDTPSPAPGEVLIRLRATALNHRDLYFVDAPIDEPVILGSDGSGVIEAVGEGVTGWPPGAEVVINPSLAWGDAEDTYDPATWSILGGPIDGTFAEAIPIAADQVYAKPARLTFEEAAALPLAGLTAYRALIVRGEAQPGQQVLIHGIGGGVAIFALQFARALGMQAMVTSTSDAKLARAAELGADLGVNALSEDWVERAKAWTDGRGVDLVIESISGEYVRKSLEATKYGGKLVTFGRTSREETKIDIGTIFWHHLSIIGATMGSPRDFAGMLAFVAEHNIYPVVDSVYPLARAREAFQHMKDRGQFGKIVLAMG